MVVKTTEPASISFSPIEGRGCEMAKMVLVSVAVLFLLVSSTSAQDDVIYPTMYENQRLATRINCQVRDPQQFHYSSVTELWGSMGGQIIVDADVILLCLGDDHGGKYESEALKYRAEVTNLQITEKKDSDKESIIRQKRGVGDFFSESWDKVKKFFKRVFGRKTRQPEVTKASKGGNDDEKIEPPVEEDSLEDINMADYQSLYSTPFQFVQLANGSIPEIRFSENEIDDRVKNFKRHIVDAFSTQLNFEQRQKAVVEKSAMGEHTSTYNVTVRDQTASLNVAGWSKLKVEEPEVVVKKFVTEGDILTLAPSDALNDRAKMDLKVQQTQVFQGGRMISSNGISSLILLPNAEKKGNRIKRDDEQDLTSYLQAHTSFDVQLQKRQKRSIKHRSQLENDENKSYFPASRVAEVEDNSERRNIQLLREIDVDVAEVIDNLANGKYSDYDEKMQALFELVEREVSLQIDKDNSSISRKIKRVLSKEMLHNLCARNFSICKDFLQLLALAGGSAAENVLLSFITEQNELSATHTQTIADIISDISRPSNDLLRSLSQIVENSLDSDTLGAICLSLGNLASKSTTNMQSAVYETFTKLLRDRHNTCRSDPFVVDLLEAIGNLKYDKAVSEVLQVSKLCSDNDAIQIASAHALRHSVHLPQVQSWIYNITRDGDCDILGGVVGSLTDKIQDQEMTPDLLFWPRFGFNEIDEQLKTHLVNSRCSVEEILLYFQRKRNSEANDIASSYFGPGSEPWNPKHATRQKRAAWDDLNCQEWTEDNNYTPIQDKEEFASDRATYNKRKSCLAFRRLGVKGANAEVYAGVFAGVKEPSTPPKYKLFTKFVSGLNFLGHQMEIGSFYFYHQSGRTKAYVRIMGRTRQEFIHEGCTPTDLSYRPLKHIPLYLVNVGAVQLSLGIHLSSQLSMDTACPGTDVYQLEPLTNVRIGGEAMGTILFARAAANLGGNFNYKLQFTFTPSPDMCLKGSHGYDPMSISFEAYYQLWNSVKRNWGKARTWKPSFLSWDVTGGNLKQWFDDTCIASASSKSAINMEREIE